MGCNNSEYIWCRPMEGGNQLCERNECPHYVEHPRCSFCGKQIPPSYVQQGGLHLTCSETEIDVYFVALPGEPKNGFYEKDVTGVADAIESLDSDSGYLVTKQKMKAGQYFNLPEFKGF